jgi:hypothetical protein
VQLQDTAEAAPLELACAILDEETDAGAILLYRLLDDSEPSLALCMRLNPQATQDAPARVEGMRAG